ncbi:MAG: T9SS type A sorting domain-containing protein [bacterium]
MKHEMKSGTPKILRLLILAVASLLVVVPSAGRAADITWTGGGGDAEWGNPLNWNGGAGPVPGATDIAYITADGAAVNREVDDLVVGGIVLGGNSGTAILFLDGGPPASVGDFLILTLNGDLTVNEFGEIHMFGTRIEGSGSVMLGGELVCNYLCFIDTPLFTTPTAHMKMIGVLGADSVLRVANGFVNRGTITLNSIHPQYTARLQVANGTLVNDSTGLIEVPVGVAFNRVLNAELDNQGTFRVEMPLDWNCLFVPNHQNSGLIEVNGAVLLLSNSNPTSTFTNTGTVAVSSGGTCRVSGSRLFHNAGQITGGGTLSLEGGTSAFINAPLEIRELAASFSSINLTSDLNTAVTGLTLYASSLNGPVTATNAPGQTVTATGDAVINTAWHNEGTLVAGASGCRINGQITTSATSRIRVEGSASQGQGGLTCLNGFTNLGAMEFGSVGTGGADRRFTVTNGTLVNGPGATIEVQVGTGGNLYFTAELNNQGLLTVLAYMEMSKASAQHVNSGEINVTGGNFYIDHRQSSQTPTFRNLGMITVATGRTLRSASPNGVGVFVNAVGGRLLGQGTYIYDLPMVNEGTVSPGASPGICSMTGSVVFSGGTLDIEVGGPTVGTEYDRLAVTGSVTLDGTLRVTFLDGFCTQPGEVFRVVTSGSCAGTFDAVEILGTGNAVLDLQYDATGLSLSTVSDLLTVGASAGSGGSISPSGPIPISCGSDLAFSITPASGFGVADVLVDGSSAGQITSHTFLDVTENHTIAASFVDVAPPTAQVLAPNGGETLHWGEIAVINWNAADNAAVDSVEVDYSLNGPGGPWVNVLRSDGSLDSVDWLVPPDPCTVAATVTAMVRVTAYDAAGNSGSDLSDAVFTIQCTATGIPDPLPTTVLLPLSLQIPNPSRAGSVPIRLSLPVAADATLEIVDVTGRRIWSTQFHGAPGRHELTWNGRGETSTPAQGIYFARLLTPLGNRHVRFVVLQ